MQSDIAPQRGVRCKRPNWSCMLLCSTLEGSAEGVGELGASLVGVSRSIASLHITTTHKQAHQPLRYVGTERSVDWSLFTSIFTTLLVPICDRAFRPSELVRFSNLQIRRLCWRRSLYQRDLLNLLVLLTPRASAGVRSQSWLRSLFPSTFVGPPRA